MTHYRFFMNYTCYSHFRGEVFINVLSHVYAYTYIGMAMYVCIMERDTAANDDQGGTGLGIGRISATTYHSATPHYPSLLGPKVEAVLRVLLGRSSCYSLLQGCEV